MSRYSPEIGALLVHCVQRAQGRSGRAPLLPGGRPPAALVEAARRHRVLPAAWLALRGEPDLDPGTAALLREEWLESASRHLLTLRDLGAAADALEAARVSFAVLKGPVLSGRDYPRPDLRPYLDLDLLVDPGGFATGLRALEEAGFTLLDRNWAVISDLMLGELHLLAPGGTSVDLHWQLLNRAKVRAPFDLAPQDLLTRVEQADLGGRLFPVLDRVDALLHVCLHASASGGDLLGWVWDVDRVAAHGVDWDALVERAKQTRTGVPAATMLLRAHLLLGLELPRDLPRRLSSRTWSAVVHWAERVDPLARTSGGRSVTHSVGRAARHSPRASLRALTARHRPRGGVHEADPARSVFAPGGDAADRARFFDSVTSSVAQQLA